MIQTRYIILSFLLSVIVRLSVGLNAMEKEAQILRKISNARYVAGIRPSDPEAVGISTTNVTILRLYADVFNVNDRLNSVDMALVVDMTWKDSRVRWDKDEENCTKNVDCLTDIDIVHGTSTYRIWTPDFQPFNSNQRATPGAFRRRVSVSSTGSVTQRDTPKFGVICEFDTTDFPYDKASCVIKYGSVLYSKRELNFVLPNFNSNVEVGMNNRHGDWKITGSAIAKESSSLDDPDIYLQVVLNMTRIPDYFNLVYKSPGLIMASYLPILHLLAPDNPAKLILPSLCSVGLIVLISTFETNVGRFPPGGSPVIIIDYVFLLILMLVSTIWSCCTSCLAACKHTTQMIPGFLRKFLKSLVVRKLCILGTSFSEEFPEVSFSHYKLKEDEEEIVKNDTLNNATRLDDLETLCKFAKDVKTRQHMEMEWYQLAVFLDRFAVVGFTILLAISYAIQ